MYCDAASSHSPSHIGVFATHSNAQLAVIATNSQIALDCLGFYSSTCLNVFNFDATMFNYLYSKTIQLSSMNICTVADDVQLYIVQSDTRMASVYRDYTAIQQK